MKTKGRFTIPTDESFVEGTKIIAEKWGADAVRDCDGTRLPENPGQFGKVYNTYFVVRGDNEWARQHPEEAQRIFLLSNRNLATGNTLEIEIMKGFLKTNLTLIIPISTFGKYTTERRALNTRSGAITRLAGLLRLKTQFLSTNIR